MLWLSYTAQGHTVLLHPELLKMISLQIKIKIKMFASNPEWLFTFFSVMLFKGQTCPEGP
jgi:hypothetical protein